MTSSSIILLHRSAVSPRSKIARHLSTGRRTCMWMHHHRRRRPYNAPPPPSPENDCPSASSSKKDDEFFPNFPWLSDHLKEMYNRRMAAHQAWHRNHPSAHLWHNWHIPSASSPSSKKYNGWWSLYRDMLDRVGEKQKAFYKGFFEEESGSGDNGTKAESEKVKEEKDKRRENMKQVRYVKTPPDAYSEMGTRMGAEQSAQPRKASNAQNEDLENTEIDFITNRRVPKQSTSKEDSEGAASLKYNSSQAGTISKPPTASEIDEAVRSKTEEQQKKAELDIFDIWMAMAYEGKEQAKSESASSEGKAPGAMSRDDLIRRYVRQIYENMDADGVSKSEISRWWSSEHNPSKFYYNVKSRENEGKGNEASPETTSENESTTAPPMQDSPAFEQEKSRLERKLDKKLSKAEDLFSRMKANFSENRGIIGEKMASKFDRKLSKLDGLFQAYRTHLSDDSVRDTLRRMSALKGPLNAKDESRINEEWEKVLEPSSEATKDTAPERTRGSPHIEETGYQPEGTTPKFRFVDSEMDPSRNDPSLDELQSQLKQNLKEDLQSHRQETEEILAKQREEADEALREQTRKVDEALDILKRNNEIYERAMVELKKAVAELNEAQAKAYNSSSQHVEPNNVWEPASLPKDEVPIEPREQTSAPAPSEEQPVVEKKSNKELSYDDMLHLSPGEMLAYLRYMEKARGKLPDEEPLPSEIIEELLRNKAKSSATATATSSTASSTATSEEWSNAEAKQEGSSGAWKKNTRRAFLTGLYVAACAYAFGVGAKLYHGKSEEAVASEKALVEYPVKDSKEKKSNWIWSN